MQKITFNLPRVAVATTLIDSYIEKHQDLLEDEKQEVVAIINGRNCVITTKFFTDYFRSELKRHKTIKTILVQFGPDQLQEIAQTSTTYKITDFYAMVDTIQKNVEQVMDSVGEYISIKNEVKDVELLALALLERGFTLGTASKEPD